MAYDDGSLFSRISSIIRESSVMKLTFLITIFSKMDFLRSFLLASFLKGREDDDDE